MSKADVISRIVANPDLLRALSEQECDRLYARTSEMDAVYLYSRLNGEILAIVKPQIGGVFRLTVHPIPKD